MKRNIELLAPGGDIDSIKAAILAGADAVYCGLNKLNARNRATNITFDDLNGIIHLAHKHKCKIFLTLNIVILESEIPYLVRLLNQLVNTNIDGVIVQDVGLFYLLSKYFPGLHIHASTQMNTHNEGQILFLNRFNATRVNLSRELTLHEIKSLTALGHHHGIGTEVFVHGSYCISFSGICYISSVLGGRSGNRGRCSQPCRDRYARTPEGKTFPLNLKDNSAFFDLRELFEAGVDSLKIEGRMKQFDYVHTVVRCWKNQILRLYDQNTLNDDNSDLYKVFNRDFSNGYLKGDIHKGMFIDNPRDHSIKHLSDIHDYSSNDDDLERDKIALYDEKEQILADVKRKIDQLSIAQSPITLSVSGSFGSPLEVSVHTLDSSFCVRSNMNLVYADVFTRNQPDGQPTNVTNRAVSLNYDELFKRLSTLNQTEYVIRDLNVDDLQSDLYISFKEFTSIRKRIFSGLNNSKDMVEPIPVPVLKNYGSSNVKPSLSVLISSPEDVPLCDQTTAHVFFQLPNGLKHDDSEILYLFSSNKKLIPWFPSVLIGEHYSAAVECLKRLQPERIVTNNTGIAYEAYKNGISWIAGPYLNSVNSLSLLCLKETFNCAGAFISNELNKNQIKFIKQPEDFKLYYSIYHPLLLLSSRQCLFQPVIGCEKVRMDEDCMQSCEKSTTITHVKNTSLFIEKSKGDYHAVYHDKNFLNTDILTELPDMFSGFFIDLRNIKTETQINADKLKLMRLFENLLNGDPDSAKELKRTIYPTTDAPYRNGI